MSQDKDSSQLRLEWVSDYYQAYNLVQKALQYKMYLETILPSSNFMGNCCNQIESNILHNLVRLVESTGRKSFLENVLLKSVKAHLNIKRAYFVIIFEFAVGFIMFLNCIVCQMNHSILNIIRIVLLRRGTYIAICIPIAFKYPINSCKQNVTTYIEFPVLD